MSTAVIQGAGGSIGLAFARHLLSRTTLNIVATSRHPTQTKQHILDSVSKDVDRDRLTVLEMDVTDERTIERAASDVRERFGDASLRLLLNVSGVVSPLFVG